MMFKAIMLRVISGSLHLSDVFQLGMDEALMKTVGWDGLPLLSTITPDLSVLGSATVFGLPRS